MPWVLWVSLGTLWVTFGCLWGGLWAPFGGLWGCLGTSLGSMPKTYPKKTKKNPPQRGKILPKRATVVIFHMSPNVGSGSKRELSLSLRQRWRGKGGTTLGIPPKGRIGLPPRGIGKATGLGQGPAPIFRILGNLPRNYFLQGFGDKVACPYGS